MEILASKKGKKFKDGGEGTEGGSKREKCELKFIPPL